MYTRGHIVRCIIRMDGTTILSNDDTFIVTLINILNGNAAFFLARIQYRFVHMDAIHAFPSELREQRRMYVYYPLRISMQDIIRNTQ